METVVNTCILFQTFIIIFGRRWETVCSRSDISPVRKQFIIFPRPYKPVTWQRTAKDLRSHADVAAAEPGARVDSDVSGHHWSWEDVADWNFLFSVASEDLLRQKHSTRWWSIQSNTENSIKKQLWTHASTLNVILTEHKQENITHFYLTYKMERTGLGC